MEHALLEMLINNGEDTKVDYKRTVQIKSKTDYEGRAEFIRDILSIANAHDEAPGYLIIGVDEDAANEDERIVDIKELGLDDADIHAFVDEYITAPIPFSFRHMEYRGKTIGVVEIPFSNNRFHFIAKDYKAENGKVLVPRGQCLIRRGTKKSPVTGYDSQRLKEYHVKQFTNTPQPDLQVRLVVGTEDDLLIHTILPEQIKNEYIIQERIGTFGNAYRTIRYPKFTAALQFAVYNEGATGADNISIIIFLPDGCSVYEKERNFLAPPHVPSIYNQTYASASDETIGMDVKYLTHNLGVYSDEVLITFPELGKTYEFAWIAHAGNMAKRSTGKLQVTVA